MVFDINGVTVGELKEVAALARGLNVSCTPSGPSEPIPTGRMVYIVDRGWIFAGDPKRTSDGYIHLSNAVWLFKWQSVGFAAVISNPMRKEVDLRECDDVEIPEASVVFRVPVHATWGLKDV